MLLIRSSHMAFCAFNFGFDVGTFGGVQGMQSFADDFGQYNAEKKSWSLSPTLRSVMTSTPFIGKAIVRSLYLPAGNPTELTIIHRVRLLVVSLLSGLEDEWLFSCFASSPSCKSAGLVEVADIDHASVELPSSYQQRRLPNLPLAASSPTPCKSPVTKNMGSGSYVDTL